jgi:hypothetical protein
VSRMCDHDGLPGRIGISPLRVYDVDELSTED